MPKPFMIGIEIEEVALGTVLRRLDGMPGVIKLHMDLQSKPNGHAVRTRHSSGEQHTTFLLRLIAQKPRSSADMRIAFKEAGRPNSVSSALTNLLKHKWVAKPKHRAGAWSVTEKGKAALAGVE